MKQAKFSIGQCVHHKLFAYRGVIIDVDPVFLGSDDWYEDIAKSRPPKDEPWYHVLVHDAQNETYVAEATWPVMNHLSLLIIPLSTSSLTALSRVCITPTGQPTRKVLSLRAKRGNLVKLAEESFCRRLPRHCVPRNDGNYFDKTELPKSYSNL